MSTPSSPLTAARHRSRARRKRAPARSRGPVLTAALAALAALAGSAAADPGYYVVTPYDNEGLAIIDFRYWSTHPRRGEAMVWPEIGFGYGVNSRWTTELLVSGIGPSWREQKASTLNWQNQVLLTQGELPLDIALHLQAVRDQTGQHEHAIEFGPLLQTDVGRTQLNANLIFEKGFGAWRHKPTMLKYQWQLRHRWLPQLHLGAQGFGEVGPWNDFHPASRQSHRAGPAAFLTFRGAGKQVLKVQAAYLFGETYAKAGQMFTMRMHVEF